MKKLLKNWKLIVSITLIIILLLVVLYMTGVISFKKNEHLKGMNGISETPKVTENEKDEEVKEKVVSEEPALNGDLTFDEEIKTTETVVYYFGNGDYDEYAKLTIEDGKINVTSTRYVNGKKDNTYKSGIKVITIRDEKVKYITSYYYQPGAGTYIMLLTESGNVYYKVIDATNEEPESISNFKQDKYSNVTGIVRIDNSSSEDNDRVLYYFGVIINGKTEKVDYKWN